MSAGVSQGSLERVAPGRQNVEILRLEVNMRGGANAPNMTNIKFHNKNSQGITRAKIY